MLRHIRMTSSGDPATPQYIPTKLLLKVRDLSRPLYQYVVPRQAPLPGQEGRVCHCRYPLYTLCSPKPSPYDRADSGGKSLDYLSESSAPVTSEAAPAPAAEGTKGRRRRQPWRGRTPSTMYHPVNVVPGRPPCYRCEVCDGFQEEEEEDRRELREVLLAGGPTGAMGSAACRGEEATKTEGEELAEEEEDEEEEKPVLSTSTDISNTTMEDTDVAHLRYQDPFLVEVLGRPVNNKLFQQLSSHFNLQLQRCGLKMRDLSTNLSHVSTVSEKHEAKYNDWLTTAGVRNKQRAREKGRRTVHLRQCVALLDTAAYAVRFAVASYGLPYELGYFNSVREIMKLVGKPHQRYTVASSEEQLESMRRMLQGECAEPLMEYAHGRFTNQPPHPSFAIVLDHEARRVVVTFRGTETVADALVDITEGYVVVDLLSRGPHIVGVEVEKARSAVPLAEAPPKVRVRLERLTRQLRAIAHTPAAFKKVDSEERKEADPSLCTRVPLGFFESVVQGAVVLLPLLEEVYAQYPDYDLFLTGHSLGGIQATLFHLFFCFSAVPDSAEEARPHQKHRLTYRTDTTQLLVPFRRTFTLTFGAAPVVEEQLLSAVNAALQREEDRSGSRLLHFMFGKDAITRLQVRSIRDLLTEEPLADAVLPTLALPGSVYLIPEGHKDFFTVEESDTVRKELVVSVDSVIHHFPLFYLRSINHLLKQYTHRWVQATNNNNNNKAN